MLRIAHFVDWRQGKRYLDFSSQLNVRDARAIKNRAVIQAIQDPGRKNWRSWGRAFATEIRAEFARMLAKGAARGFCPKG